jgi:hypothetical protein
LVLVINDTKLLIPCVKCFELGISNTCDEGVRGKEWWPQDHLELVHEMMSKIMKRCTLNDGHDDQVEEKDLRAQGKGITIGFSFCRSKMSIEK